MVSVSQHFVKNYFFTFTFFFSFRSPIFLDMNSLEKNEAFFRFFNLCEKVTGRRLTPLNDPQGLSLLTLQQTDGNLPN